MLSEALLIINSQKLYSPVIQVKLTFSDVVNVYNMVTMVIEPLVAHLRV